MMSQIIIITTQRILDAKIGHSVIYVGIHGKHLQVHFVTLEGVITPMETRVHKLAAQDEGWKIYGQEFWE
jgi:hypothetical protein